MKKQADTSITMPLLKDLMERERVRQASLPQVENKPITAADLMHDPGNGYDSDLSFPQE